MTNSKQILIIDLKSIPDTISLYQEFATELADYNINKQSGEAFCSAIVELAKKNNILILYNFRDFKRYNYYDAELLGFAVFNFNQLDLEMKIIYDEYNEIFQTKNLKSLESIFQREPSQYGYRGDKYLWKELKDYFIDKPMPESEELLINQIYKAILTLTGHTISKRQSFHLKKYDNGGMSGGAINSEYWMNILIPILIGRYGKLREIYIMK